MNPSVDMIYDIKRKMLTKYPRFGSEIAVANIEFRDDLPFHTAATDGKNIYVDPKYFESLSENDRLFTIAHEIMHIKFMHMYRLADKDGKKRDPELWNIATDAIINANLERDGFTRKDGRYSGTDVIKYPFKIIRNELGIKARFYDLRGSFATTSLRNGCEIKDIAEVLGHSSIETTEKYYISSTEKDKRRVTKSFEKSLKIFNSVI